MNKGIFITGTDTAVGKTIITGLLGRFFVEQGINVVTQKWVETGCGEFSEDIDTHLRLMGIERQKMEKYLKDVVPYTFKFASSPHLAALMENREISSKMITRAFQNLACKFERVIVEGSGGALVPINAGELLVDIAKKLHLPVLIVAENKLGAINHTLLTIEALKKRNLKIIGVIFNRIVEQQEEIILKDNLEIIEKLSGIKVLGEVCYSENKEALYERFRPIGENVFRLISNKSYGHPPCLSE